MFILPDTQEAIVPQEQWDRVQELRKNKRRITKGERQGLDLAEISEPVMTETTYGRRKTA